MFLHSRQLPSTAHEIIKKQDTTMQIKIFRLFGWRIASRKFGGNQTIEIAKKIKAGI